MLVAYEFRVWYLGNTSFYVEKIMCHTIFEVVYND